MSGRPFSRHVLSCLDEWTYSYRIFELFIRVSLFGSNWLLGTVLSCFAEGQRDGVRGQDSSWPNNEGRRARPLLRKVLPLSPAFAAELSVREPRRKAISPETCTGPGQPWGCLALRFFSGTYQSLD